LWAGDDGLFTALNLAGEGKVMLVRWLYLMGAVILIGGKINAEIARAADVTTVQKEKSWRPR
jgi:uncharacterized BrkB/YihY/UPF0761 family membrane protein